MGTKWEVIGNVKGTNENEKNQGILSACRAFPLTA
jgi:hypothetical protein